MNNPLSFIISLHSQMIWQFYKQTFFDGKLFSSGWKMSLDEKQWMEMEFRSQKEKDKKINGKIKPKRVAFGICILYREFSLTVLEFQSRQREYAFGSNCFSPPIKERHTFSVFLFSNCDSHSTVAVARGPFLKFTYYESKIN